MGSASVRLFISSSLALGIEVPGTSAHAHYLGNVMRCQSGDRLRVFNEQSGEWEAEIILLRRSEVVFRPLALLRAPAAEPDFWLCFALLKRHRTDMVVEKATELGVSRLVPVITARTNADHVNLDRLNAIAIEAAEQCERLAVPVIDQPQKLGQLLSGWPAERGLAVADERRTAPLAGGSQAVGALLIGPEGGFAETELETILARPFVTRVSLGARLLRAETAAIAGLALLLASVP
jgi:16S rRNA (uracil1498-N3)-methyltransferase